MGQFLVHGRWHLNPVPVSDLDQVVLKELMAKNRGLTVLDHKKRSEYSSVTTTSGECSDEQETLVVSTPLADADDRPSEIASAIPLVDPEVLTLKHSAFLAQLLMDEVALGDCSHGGSHDHAAFSMQATDGPTGQVPGAKPSPKNMPVSWYDVQDLQQVLSAKAQDIERQTRLDLLKRTWKTSIWHIGLYDVKKSKNYLRCELGHDLSLTLHFNSFQICYEAKRFNCNVSSGMSLLL